MATRSHDTKYEVAHMRHLIYKVKIPLPPGLTSEALMGLAERGVLTVSSVLENAIAEMGGLEVARQDTHDLSDGSEVKYATTRRHSNLTSLSAKIRGLHNKTGTLRVQVLEFMSGQFYYFLIPYDEYAGRNGLEIPFSRTGEPKRFFNNSGCENIWRWQVPTFADMCAPLPDHLVPLSTKNLVQDLFVWS